MTTWRTQPVCDPCWRHRNYATAQALAAKRNGVAVSGTTARQDSWYERDRE